MSIKKISKIQPEKFEFTTENLSEAENEIKKYPKERKASAILALLHLVQKQNNNLAIMQISKTIRQLILIQYLN